jgi:hypothetical protein
LKISPHAYRAQPSEIQRKGIKEFLKSFAPEMKTLGVIRAKARKKGKGKLSAREINREIRTYRREAQLQSIRENIAPAGP